MNTRVQIFIQNILEQIKDKKRNLFFISAIGLFLIFGFWDSQQKIQDFLFSRIAGPESLQKIDLEPYYASLKPFRNWEATPLDLESLSAISIQINEQGNKKFLYHKNTDTKLAIASLTKLMTAYIALENYDLNQEIIISHKADFIEGSSANLRTGQAFYVKDLIYSLLMESSNESAQALSEKIGEQRFIYLMNEQAQKWGLKNTYFIDPIGLDPDHTSISPNYSTATDLATLIWQAFKDPFIKQVLTTKELQLYTTQGAFHHLIKNNNELLNGSEISWKNKILGAKTGWTPMAGECLMLILQGKNNDLIINVILGSSNRFQEMKQLTNWLYSAYKW